MKPLVSIVILNWNGKKHLATCLRSIEKVTYKPLEVIVVDNASTDRSVEFVQKSFPWVNLMANNTNKGFSGGNNQGIQKSRGPYIFILNNDTEVTPGFLEPLVAACERDKTIGCIQPKLVYASDHTLLNAVGSFLTSTGFLYHYGYRKDTLKAQYNRRMDIYSAKGAAMMLRASALKKVGVFDKDFFIFFEETDLCHRLWLSNFRVVYEPTSLIYHAEAVDTHREFPEFRITYLSFRNRICSFIKNLEPGSLLLMLTALFVVYLALTTYYLIRLQPSLSAAIILSVLWNICELPKTLRKRRDIQQNRIISDSELFTIVKRDPPLVYYYYLFTNLRNWCHEKPMV